MNSVRFLAAVGLIGLAAAAFTVDRSGLHAESPLEFFTKQHRQAPRYEREPVEVPREGGGMFGFFDEFFDEEPQGPQVSTPRNLQRVVCRRQCDGAQLVLGFVAGNGKQKQNEAMCAAAGRGAKTELIVQEFEPGKGFAPPPVQSASAAPVMEGRAALDTTAKQQMPAPASSSCPPSAEKRAFMSVPILNDATLRNGDVVAMKGGFKVFVGKGKPPFKQSDFVDLDTRKRVSADLKKLRVSDR
jgi:hypothetical protein